MSHGQDPKAFTHIPLAFQSYSPEQMHRRAADFEALMTGRRSIREFSDRPVPRALIEAAIRTASSAPSGAHQQPWTFVAISNPSLKRRIREAAEHEEYINYEGGRMPEAWHAAIAPFGTDWRKPYLETVPWIVVVFQQTYGIEPDSDARKTHYYVKESVGIACGMFITALHHMGLATLTHTPSPMGFLSQLLERPKHEKPYILFPIGYPAEHATVPGITRKSLDEVSVWLEGE
ncbi:MAG: nitroreductase family protein [Myxococcota bacterium]